MAIRNDITYEILYKLYFIDKKQIKEISKLLKCGYNTVNRKLIKYNLKKSNSMEGTRIYHSWYNMKSSCRYQKCSGYKYIGKLGITYSENWEKFKGFYNDMSKNYADNLFLSRKDKNENFTKENCYWATKEEYFYNRSDNIKIFVGGKFMTAKQASQKYNIKEKTIQARYEKGWKGNKLIEPIKESYIDNFPDMKRYFENGGIKTPNQYKDFGVQKKLFIRQKYNNICQECGMTNEEAIKLYGCSLHIHHINYNKRDGNVTNLILLCTSCHMKTNHNRDKWEKYYKEKIAKETESKITN